MALDYTVRPLADLAWPGKMTPSCARNWQDNVKAIALALEALRKVDRYGVQQGSQYAGFKKLAATTAPAMTVQIAADILSLHADVLPSAILQECELARQAVRIARFRNHPDRNGGSDREWQKVEVARQILEQHHNCLLT